MRTATLTARFAWLVLLLSLPSAHAADVTAVIADQKVDVLIRGAKYPETIRKDLKSGLTNRLLIRITLSVSERVIGRKAVEITVETFVLPHDVSCGLYEAPKLLGCGQGLFCLLGFTCHGLSPNCL